MSPSSSPSPGPMRQVAKVEDENVLSRAELWYSLKGMPNPFRSPTPTMRLRHLPKPIATKLESESTGPASAAAAVLGDYAAAAAGANGADVSDVEMTPAAVIHEYVSVTDDDLRLGRPAFIARLTEKWLAQGLLTGTARPEFRVVAVACLRTEAGVGIRMFSFRQQQKYESLGFSIAPLRTPLDF